MKRAIGLLALCLVVTLSGATSGTVDSRAVGLLSQMTSREKLAMLHGADTDFSGRVPGVPRLGIPELILQDGPAGVRRPGTTALPAPIALAASWDPQLAMTYGTIIGTEDRALGINVDLGPMVNIVRTAEAGRDFESFGEDPYLESAMVAPEIRAIQAQHVIATVKHYAVNNQEDGRLRDSSNVDDRAFHEIYLPAFAAAARAGVGAAMCAYNRVNTVWACENPQTLDTLRGVGFKGFVMSDWGATHSTAPALRAGLDMEMPDDANFGKPLVRALAHGTVAMSEIDRSVQRILHAILAVGVREPATSGAPLAVDRASAREIEDRSVVLLRNTGVLPLNTASLHSIALIGAAQQIDLRGGSGWVPGTGTVSPREGLASALGSRVRIDSVWAASPPFRGDVPSVDSLALTPPRNLSGHGLRAEYFNNDTLSGRPVLTRNEPALWYMHQGYGDPTILKDTYSVRWSGTLTAPATGTYDIGVEGEGIRMEFNGVRIVDAWNKDTFKTRTARERLIAGHRYPIVVEMRSTGWFQLARLAWQPPSGVWTQDVASAVRLARKDDVAVVFVGEYRTEALDRTTIALTGGQSELIEAVARANPHTIVVVQNGGPIAIGDWARSAPAILDMWYPGEEFGNALADVILGRVNPSGKLPMTYPATPDDVVANVAWPAEPYDGPMRNVNYSEKLDVGYRWYDAHAHTPLFPFGFGLSYTTFSVGDAAVSTPEKDGSVMVTATVRNTGKRAGVDVAQVYVEFPPGAGEPPHQLKGFARVALEPGESKQVRVTLDRDSFQYWNAAVHGWRVYPGNYQIFIGDSSRSLRLAGSMDAGDPLPARAPNGVRCDKYVLDVATTNGRVLGCEEVTAGKPGVRCSGGFGLGAPGATTQPPPVEYRFSDVGKLGVPAVDGTSRELMRRIQQHEHSDTLSFAYVGGDLGIVMFDAARGPCDSGGYQVLNAPGIHNVMYKPGEDPLHLMAYPGDIPETPFPWMKP